MAAAYGTMDFHEYCVFPRFGNDQGEEFFTNIHYMFVQKSFDMSEGVKFMVRCLAIQ